MTIFALTARCISELVARLSGDVLYRTDEVKVFLDHLRYFSLAESLGGVESLVAHPASMTHASMDPLARQTAGISDGLLRLSVGIEDADDLCEAVQKALDAVLVLQREPA